ncbi:MAG: DUF6765 family protein [Pseudomonadota bacterium]
MDIEFHYWITGYLAQRAGFDQDAAHTIAYASQYVDENDISYEIEDRSGKRSKYINFMSQTMNILKPKGSLMRIYPIFHFIPGDPQAYTARRRDGKMHLLNTTPDNEHANAMLQAAFAANEDTRLYRIGIASHSYVDTWAHQNFVGWYDHYNQIELKPVPAIGHAPGGHHPDWVCHEWTDQRLVDDEISNRNRFLDAACALFKHYCTYQASQGSPDNTAIWPELEADLVTMCGQTYTGDDLRYQEARLKSYRKRLDWFPEFDEESWFNAAIDTQVRGLKDNPDGLLNGFTLLRDRYYWKEGVAREDTHWYRFQQAVKDHEKFGIVRLSPLFRKMGYDLAIV